MDLKTLLTADYLDIIFDKRNKIYGGYELRKNYTHRLKKATGFAMLGVAALFTFSFVAVNHKENFILDKGKVIAVADIHILPPPIKLPAQLHAAPPAPPQAANIKTDVFTNPDIVKNVDAPDDKIVANVSDPNLHPSLSASNDGPDGSMAPTAGGGGDKTGTIPSTTTPSKPLVWVSQMPQFIGDMSTYLGKQIKYPESARENGIEGSVVVQFVINEDGAVTNATIVKGIGGGCDQEALRIINGMPKWKPGRQNTIPVKVLFSLSIKFELQS